MEDSEWRCGTGCMDSWDAIGFGSGLVAFGFAVRFDITSFFFGSWTTIVSA